MVLVRCIGGSNLSIYDALYIKSTITKLGLMSTQTEDYIF